MVTSTVISAALLTRQPYDPVRDLAPIINLARVANILVVHPSLPVRNVPELIALARARPGALTFGSPGIGSAVHISGEMFKLAAQVDMVHAPYRGGGPALADLVSGHIQLMFGNASSTLPFVRDGSLRAIAVTSASRAAYLPNVPTVAEQGLPGFAIEEWYACLGPAGMNPRAVERINAAFNTVIAEPSERARLLEMGAEVVGGSAEEFGRFYREEVEKIARVVRTHAFELSSGTHAFELSSGTHAFELRSGTPRIRVEERDARIRVQERDARIQVEERDARVRVAERDARNLVEWPHG
jgi:tripartite-type tricarboxylate transporter receptor subunit TctC